MFVDPQRLLGTSFGTEPLLNRLAQCETVAELRQPVTLQHQIQVPGAAQHLLNTSIIASTTVKPPHCLYACLQERQRGMRVSPDNDDICSYRISAPGNSSWMPGRSSVTLGNVLSSFAFPSMNRIEGWRFFAGLCTNPTFW